MQQPIYGYYNEKKITKGKKAKINPIKSLGKITDNNYEILLKALSKGEEVEYEYDDPFFSLENVKRLTRAIEDINAGKAVLTEHELIEVEDNA